MFLYLQSSPVRPPHRPRHARPPRAAALLAGFTVLGLCALIRRGAR